MVLGPKQTHNSHICSQASLEIQGQEAPVRFWPSAFAQSFSGITAGATFAGALRVCQDAPAGSTVLCMLPDTGERYLSTPLFAEVPVDMNEEEWEIARSTPGCILEPPK